KSYILKRRQHTVRHTDALRFGPCRRPTVSARKTLRDCTKPGDDARIHRHLLDPRGRVDDHVRPVLHVEEKCAGWGWRTRGCCVGNLIDMKIRIVTIEREYGSGAAKIAERLAQQISWKLWDELLTTEIARLAECDRCEVEEREERMDPLYYRLLKSVLRGSFEGSLNVRRLKLLDA